MDGMWECPKCQGLTKVTVMSAPVRCQQCGADMRRVGPTDTERLAKLEKDLRELRERFLRRETDYRARAPYDGSGSACGDCASAVEDLMRENDISPDGEGGG